jgi:hypothetical protein
MFKGIKSLGLLVVFSGLLLSSGIAEAHQLKSDHGYTAVMHIDPDDDPSAGEPSVINFLIGKDGASYNQNKYDIAVDISADGQPTGHVPVESAVFGNAADGVAKYVFPGIAAYTINLTGHLKTDVSDKFQMSFIVRVADTAAAPKSAGSGLDALILSAGSLLILAMVAYRYILLGGRYAKRS